MYVTFIYKAHNVSKVCRGEAPNNNKHYNVHILKKITEDALWVHVYSSYTTDS